MQLLLDTHTLIWALEDNPKLSEEVKNIIINLDNIVFVSSASIWEIAIKNSVKKDFPYNPKEIISLCTRAGFRFIGIGLEEIKIYNSLKIKTGETVNNDPFDRILVSQAKVNNMKLITHDHMINKYDEECVFYY